MIYSNGEELWRAALTGAVAYICLIAVLRTTGKRTLSKLNAFDFVVTVALGSALASALMTSGVTAARAATAFAILALLQLAASWASVRWRAVRRATRAEPTLLVDHGTMLHDNLRAQRVTEGEILQAVRREGVASLAEVVAVVLETDGSLSVVRGNHGDRSALRDVER